jgi:hypothetical protein
MATYYMRVDSHPRRLPLRISEIDALPENPYPKTTHSPGCNESILRNLASKLKLHGAGRIVLAVRVRLLTPPDRVSLPPDAEKAAILDFVLFHLKEKVTDGKQAGTEHTGLVPQHREERQVRDYHLPAQRRQVVGSHPFLR